MEEGEAGRRGRKGFEGVDRRSRLLIQIGMLTRILAFA